MMVWYDDQSSEEPQDRTIQMKLICIGLWGPERKRQINPCNVEMLIILLTIFEIYLSTVIKGLFTSEFI